MALAVDACTLRACFCSLFQSIPLIFRASSSMAKAAAGEAGTLERGQGQRRRLQRAEKEAGGVSSLAPGSHNVAGSRSRAAGRLRALLRGRGMSTPLLLPRACASPPRPADSLRLVTSALEKGAVPAMGTLDVTKATHGVNFDGCVMLPNAHLRPPPSAPENVHCRAHARDRTPTGGRAAGEDVPMQSLRVVHADCLKSRAGNGRRPPPHWSDSVQRRP
jgi:hypothetical protein